MCDVSDGFKLCTCAPDAPVDWVLQRAKEPTGAQLDGMFMIRGMGPIFTEDDDLQILFVLDGLQAGNCFDFPYTPAEGDVLTFRRIGPHGCSFRYQGEGWVEESFPELLALTVEGEGHVELEAEKGLAGEPLWEELKANPYDQKLREQVRAWLAETGRTVLADWLSMEEAAREGQHPPGFQDVARKISLRIRARLARSKLACDKRKCLGEWSKLNLTKDPLVRRCNRCSRKGEFGDRPAHSGRSTLWVAAPSMPDQSS